MTMSNQTAPATQSAAPTEWTLDVAHTQVGFRVRHMMVSWTRGHFGKFAGTVHFEEGKPESLRAEVEIETASIDTNDEKRDGHLRSADFFDAEKYPKVRFVSRSSKAKGSDGLLVEGDLTIRDVTRPVTIEVSDIGPAGKDPWGQTHRGAAAVAKISRKDFGLNWNAALETGGVLVGDEIQIQLDIELLAKS
jgi:polyisoprenoid-binding protein YceI